MDISTEMACLAGFIGALVWTLHHFKSKIKFGKVTGRITAVLNWIRNNIFRNQGTFKTPGPDEIQGRYERLMAVLIMIGCGAATLAAAAMLSLVWQFARHWILGLIGIALIGAIWIWHMIVRGNGHHVVRTNAVAALYGIVMALLWGGWAGLDAAAGQAADNLRKLSQSAVTGHAPTNPGHAAHVSTGAQHLAALIFCVVVGALVLTVIASIRKEHSANKPSKKPKKKRGGDRSSSRGGSSRGGIGAGGGGIPDLPSAYGGQGALPDAGYGS